MQKQYADKRRHSKISDIEPGDKVLVKQNKQNKLTTNFSPTEHTVIWKTGNTVATQSPDGKIIRRNSTHFQPIRRRDMSRFSMQKDKQILIDEKEDTDSKDGQEEESKKGDNDTENIDSTLTNDNTVTKRPIRQYRAPGKYKDFVLGLILDCLSDVKCKE